MQHLNPMHRSGRPFILAVVALLVPLWAGGLASANAPHPSRPSHGGGPRPTIVLLHGDWADASSWNAVTERLQRRGYTVVAPPNPLRGPSSDARLRGQLPADDPRPDRARRALLRGFVITNAATGNPNIEALVYIDAMIPDAGQTGEELVAGACVHPATALNPVPAPGGVIDLYLRLEPKGTYPGYAECFANGVNQRQAALLFAGQRPAAAAQFTDPSGTPAWETIPSWSLIGTADLVITPAQQQAMSTNAGATISTVNAGHLSLITRPKTVSNVIETAVDATT